jgi:uncharacterized protein YndB with AHSA1/START domain
MTLPDEALSRSVTVPAPVDRAFAVFTDGLSDWWPRDYTWSGDRLEVIALEPREGGHCYEIGPGGFHLDWGTILAWDPPGRLVLAWQISPARVPEPEPARASEVEVTFTTTTAAASGSSTEVTLEHRHFSRHGDSAAAYRSGMDSEQGWPLILSRYAAAVRGDR